MTTTADTQHAPIPHVGPHQHAVRTPAATLHDIGYTKGAL